MGLDFDVRGNLKPYERKLIEFEELKQFFVEEFENISQVRKEIFDDYLNYLEDFEKEITSEFSQWINGSFITNKANPKDIDFVTLIDHETFEEKEKLIEERFRRQNAKNIYGKIDPYVVKVYPEDHERYFVTKFDLVYWDNLFSETKKNRAKKKFKKGYLEARFSNKKQES